MKSGILLVLLCAAGATLATGYRAAAQQMQAADLYINPQPVEISGYNSSAMEPFISPDGKFLFFNNDDDPRTHNKSMHFARRTGPLSFRYLGELPGVNMHTPEKVEAAPSMDTSGHFFFTSTRQYEQDFHTVFSGDFDGNGVTNVHAVEGDINAGLKHGVINMDMSISPDGNTLYISRAHFGPLSLLTHAPTGSQLLIARRDGNRFNLDPNSAQIMKNVDTGMEYAPAVSADGLELYFNRATRIMVATRAAADQPFGAPSELRATAGFVEAPTISLDRKELFFHKNVSDVCCVIYRATRFQ